MALAHGRKEPVIHRDGKPNNVMLTKEGLAKLMDFGIARMLEEADELTRTGQVLGTPEYMPPELRLPKGLVDIRTDVYLLGALLQEMMTFHPCGDVEARADLPPGWCDLIHDATSRVRSKRPASAQAFLDRLVGAPQSLDQVAEANQRVRQGAEEKAREHLRLGNFAEGLNVVRSLEEHRRPREVEQQLARVATLLPRLESFLKADKLQGWMRPTVEELAALCPARSDLARLLQRNELKRLAPGAILKNSLGMEFAWMPPTAWYEEHFQRPYRMGSPNGVGHDDERPQHRVTFTRGFWMAVTPVTQAQWKRVMGGADPSRSDHKGADRPVDSVSWHDCRDFCKRLQDLDKGHWGGFMPSYDLPTEAEWEYACRAGTTTAYFFGDTEAQLGDYAWFGGNSGKATHPVKTRKANPWSLHDVLGNVWEWCLDSKEPYTQGDKQDPCDEDYSDKENKKSRVLRGGAYCYDAAVCRAAFRLGGAPGHRVISFGCRPRFRLD